MYYFFMDRNFNLDKYDFDVNFSPRLTKAERDLSNIFLDNVDRKNEYTELNYDFNLFKLSYFELIENIKSIKKKVEILSLNKGNINRRPKKKFKVSSILFFIIYF